MSIVKEYRPVGKLYGREDVAAMAAQVRAACPGCQPQIGLYTGTGFAAFGEQLANPVTIPYGSLPFLPDELQCPGHVPEFVLGRVQGHDLICARGKMFLFDGVPAQLIALPVRLFHALGCRTLIYTNTVGAINPSFKPGDFVFLHNHINLLGQNPLTGEREGEFGTVLVDMTYPYDAELRAIGEGVASGLGIPIHEGVYGGVHGPSFETAAEIEGLKRLGADMVGMSTVFEVIAARQLGMRVLGIGFVSNMAAGLVSSVGNDEVIETTAAGQDRYASLIGGILAALRG